MAGSLEGFANPWAGNLTGTSARLFEKETDFPNRVRSVLKRGLGMGKWVDAWRLALAGTCLPMCQHGSLVPGASMELIQEWYHSLNIMPLWGSA